MRHLENMNKIILVTGCMVGYAYSMEFFIAWYSGAMYESFAFMNRAFGQHAWAYWIMVSCNVIVPQIFWFKKARHEHSDHVHRLPAGERRHVVRAVRDHRHARAGLPAQQLGLLQAHVGRHASTLIGSFGLFMTLFLLFIRYLPVIAIAEIKAVMPQADPHRAGTTGTTTRRRRHE